MLFAVILAPSRVAQLGGREAGRERRCQFFLRVRRVVARTLVRSYAYMHMYNSTDTEYCTVHISTYPQPSLTQLQSSDDITPRRLSLSLPPSLSLSHFLYYSLPTPVIEIPHPLTPSRPLFLAPPSRCRLGPPERRHPRRRYMSVRILGATHDGGMGL